MANQHITAALRCSQFKGTARLVLFALADAASPGKVEGKKTLPIGFTRLKLQTIMSRVNIRRQQTVSAGIAELKAAGAIRVQYHKQACPLFFVDLDWLREHAYTDAQLEEFEYASLKAGREARVADASPAGHPPVGGGLDIEQRKAANLDNGKRISSTTDSVTEDNGKRLTGFQSFPILLQREAVCSNATADTRPDTDKTEEQNQQQPLTPVYPPAPAAIDIPPAAELIRKAAKLEKVMAEVEQEKALMATHSWLRSRPRMDDECQKPGCGQSWWEARESKEPCCGDKAEGASA